MVVGGWKGAVMSKLGMHYSPKLMWGCVAILALLVVLSVAGANVGFLLFAIPCMLMMGAMMWMMMRGMGGGDSKR
jgi:hypothetical protein